MNLFMIYMTAKDKDEARKIGRHIVTSNLAACVNIIDNMNALYVWNGQLQDDQEAVMIAKTTEDKVPDLIKAVKQHHSYECPCIVTLPIADGNPGFLQWVAEQVAPSESKILKE